MGKDAKQAMKTDAEKKQELEQTTEIDRETPQVEPELGEHAVSPENTREESGKMSNPDNGMAPPPAEISEGSVSIWDSDTELQQKYGVDIIYVPHLKEFAYKKYEYNADKNTFETKFVYFEERDFSKDAWNDEHLKNMVDKFSFETDYLDIPVNYHDLLKDEWKLQKKAEAEGINRTPNSARTLMSYAGDTVFMYRYEVPENELAACRKLYQKLYGVSKEEADAALKAILAPPEDTLKQLSLVEHELSHREDDKKFGLNQYDLPPEYMAKLDMLTEIKACTVQAGYALDMYDATGNTKYFDGLPIYEHYIDELKETIENNPNMENRQEYVAQFVYDKWLETYNHSDTVYSNQAYELTTPKTHKYPLWAMVDNQEALDRYHERVDAMFENVIGFGDIRKIANPDFELNDDLSRRLEWDNPMDNELLRAIMTKDAHNADQYIANLITYLNKLKEIDADGIRTPDELAQIDANWQEITNPQETPEKHDVPSMASTAAKMHRSERGR